MSIFDTWIPGFLVLSVLTTLSLRWVFSSLLLTVVFAPLLLLLGCLIGLCSPIFIGFWLDNRREVNPKLAHQYVPKQPAFATPAAWQAVLTRERWSHKSPRSFPPLRPNFPLVSATLNDVMIMIVRDFVLVWYNQISSYPAFPIAVSTTLHYSLEALLDRLEKLDMATLIVRRILPKVTTHVKQFRQSETALRGTKLERHLTQSEEMDLVFASRYAGKGERLHPAVDNLSSVFTKQTEEAHLRDIVEKVLPLISPDKEQTKAVRIVFREILACSVLGPLMDMLADPDFWNRTIDQLAGAAIQQQKLISKLRNVLEAQVHDSSKPSTAPTTKRLPAEKLTLHTDPQHFDSFLRNISKCDSLPDARQFRNDVDGEIRRTRSSLADHERDDWINGKKKDEVIAFLDRLYKAKSKVEKRIVILGEEDVLTASSEVAVPRLSLHDVLTNPRPLSYFLEFMDRRGRSLPVQFWLTVEGFKNPLESVKSSSSDEENEDLLLRHTTSSTLKQDISMLADSYFAEPATPPALSVISKDHVQVIQSFAHNTTNASPSLDRKVQRSVVLAQRQVEQSMQLDYDEFQSSELWFRVIGDLEPNHHLHALAASEAASSPRPAPLKHMSHSVALLASLVHGFAPDMHRGRSEDKSAAARLPWSESSPALADVTSREQKRPSLELPRFVQNPSSRSVSNPNPASTSNLDILMSPPSPETLGESSRVPLFDESEGGRLNSSVFSLDAQERERMEAIQAAVTDILNEDPEPDERPTVQRAHSSDSSLNKPFVRDSELRAESRRRAVFDDSVVEEFASPAAVEQDDEADEASQEALQLAAPGYLQLSYEISRLEENITKLQSQHLMLDTLIRKAELTGDAQELRLLQRSKSALGRELRQLMFQKNQYEQQESANKLVPGRTIATIVNSAVGEEEGKAVVRYLIEVQQLAPNGTFASGWVVARRYNEFFSMHQRLREKYLVVRNLDFPGKRLVTALSVNLVDSRRVALEKYLQNLLTVPLICESDELRAFLTRESPFVAAAIPRSPSISASKETSSFPGHNFVKTVYRSFAGSLDDIFFGPSMLDLMIGRLIRQAAESAGIVGSGVTDEDLVTQALKASGKTMPEETGDLKPIDGETSTSTFSAPICDFILAVFELDKSNNWLRRQAVVIILQQVLGDTIERKLRDSIKALLEETRLLTFINMFKDGLWPGGKLKPSGLVRSADDRARTREDASRKLSALLPDVAANMIGRSNARRGARRIFAVLQNRRLNQHIAYTILDEILVAVFPEINLESSSGDNAASNRPSAIEILRATER